MKHLGDITKINGADAEIVDVICGGSPCQDLSVAGKRAGLQHSDIGSGETTRSGLFMEQIRIIKEMRNEFCKQLRMRGADVDFRIIKPRFMVWENVPGAFSSNKGEDFRIVLEETAKIADENSTIPRPADGKWQKAGVIMGDGYSLAWRVTDAQWHGTPQRRKRICLIADFNGKSAPRILFELRRKTERGESEQTFPNLGSIPGREISVERKSLSRNIEESRKEGQGAATDIERSIGASIDGIASTLTASYGTKWNGNAGAYTGGNFVLQTGVNEGCVLSFKERAGKPGGGKGILIQDERTGALSTVNNQSVCYGISSYNSNSMKSSNPHSGIYEADTSRTLDLNGGNPACNQGGMMVVEGADMYNQSLTGEKAMSITGAATDPHHIPCVVLEGNVHCHTYRKQGHPQNAEQGQGWEETNVNDTLNAFDSGEIRTPTLVVENHPSDSREKRVYDWHRQDTRMTECKDVCVTCAADWGCGGNNMPYVMENQTYQNKTGTLSQGAHPGSYNGQDAYNDMFIANQSVVRRLTPLECERLQGFPDGWTDIGEWVDSKGKKHKDADSPRYKALGNSIAVGYANGRSGFWCWMARRMVEVLREDGEENPTMASLFDGIGGFPLAFSACGCRPVWASEIEEFPMAVTKIRFPEDEEG